MLTLWSLKNAGANGLSVDALPDPPRAGLTSFTPDPACPEAFYRAYGYHVCGPRAVRLDMLERLADLIRPLLAWRGTNGATPPKGATGDGGFTVIPEMMSLLGCSPDELGGVLKALGFRLDRRPIKTDAAAASAAETPCRERRSHAAPEARGRRNAPPSAAPPSGRCRRRSRRSGCRAEYRCRAGAPPPKVPPQPLLRRRSTRTSGARAGTRAASAGPSAASATGSAAAIARPPCAAPAPPERCCSRRAQRQRHSLRVQAREPEQPRSQGRSASARQGARRRARPHATATPASIGAARRPSAGRAATIAATITAARPRCTPPLRLAAAASDPDSPFAALGALRDELAKRGKETST